MSFTGWSPAERGDYPVTTTEFLEGVWGNSGIIGFPNEMIAFLLVVNAHYPFIPRGD
jgi:hypothetical protein